MLSDMINTPKTKRGQATLERIVQAAIEIFYEKGYHEASINDITSRASVASGTFYIYFDGKYNLYRYLLLMCSHEIRKAMSLAVKGCKTRREAEKQGMRTWLEFTINNRFMYHIIWESMYIDKQLFVDYYTGFCASYSRHLDAAKAKDEVLDIDSEVLSYTLMGITNFFGLNWGLFKEEDSVTPEELDRVTEEYMKILDYGIFPRQKNSQI